MLQTFKRIYLYTAASFALIFTAVIARNLLANLFRLAGVDANSSEFGIPSSPSSSQVTSDLLFFVVTLVVIGLGFGGLHYWLIRRDARADPGALGGVTRHVFVNGLMALSTLIAVPNALTVLGHLGQTNVCCSDDAGALAYAVMFALVFLYVEWERRRAQPVGNAATLMRKIHENVLQGVLLIIASFFVFYAVRESVFAVLVQQGTLRTTCEGPGSICEEPFVLGPVVQALFAIAAWGLYVWLGVWDQRSRLRWTLRFLMYAYGIGWFLVGVGTLAQTVAEQVLGIPNAWRTAQEGGLLFLAQLVTGALIAVPYFFWIRRVSRASANAPTLASACQEGLLAVPAGLSAALFLAGLAMVLSGWLEQIVPGGSPPSPESWASAWASLIAGLGYLPLWVVLRRVSNPALGGPMLPRRAYVLVLLAGTAIVAVGLVATAIYQFLKVSLGIEGGDALLARQAFVGAVVTGVTALYHLWQLRADLRVLHARQAAAQPVAAVGAGSAGISPAGVGSAALEALAPEIAAAPVANGASETLESILRDVAAGSLEPLAAASRIRALPTL